MASRIQGITVEIGGDTTKLTTALKGVNSEIRNTQSQLRDVEKLLKLDPGNMELLSQKQRLLNEEVQTTKEKLEVLKTASEQANAAMEEGTISKDQYDALQREIIATEQVLEDLEEQAGQSAVALQKIANAGESLKSAGDKVTDVGKKMSVVSAGIVAAGTASTKAALDFEDAMAKVSTIADATEVPIDELEKAILDLSNQTGISSTEIADNVYNAISAGQSTGDAVNFVSNSTKLAKSGFADAGDALDILTTILNAYGLEASEVTNVSDMLIQTQNLGKTTVAELSSAMGKVIPTANAYGVQLDQLCAGYAIMTANGVATAESTTYMNSMLNELGKSGTKVSDILKEKTGSSFAELMNSGYSLSDCLAIIGDAAAEQGLAFGNMWSSSEAAKAGLILLGDSAETFNGTLAEMQNSTGATDTAFEKLKTNSYTIQMAINQLKNTAIELGNAIMSVLAPLLMSLAETISKLTTWFSGLSDGTKRFIVIGMVVAAVGPVLIIVGKIMSAVGTIMTVVPKLAGVINAVKTAFAALNTTMLANPIFLIIAAITALAAAFIYLWNTNEEFRQFWINLWENIKEVAIAVWTAIKEFFVSAWETISNAAQTIWNGIKNFFSAVWEGIKTIFTTVLNVISTVVTTYFNIYKTIITTAFNAIKTVITTVLSAIKTVITTVWNTIKNVFTTVLNTIKSVVSGAFNSMWTGIKNTVSGIVNTIKTGFGNAVSFIKNLASSAFQWGADIIQGIVNGIRSCIGKVKDAVTNVAATIRSFLHFSVPDEGPLTDYESWMPDFMSGLAKGIEQSKNMVAKAVEGAAGDMVISPQMEMAGVSRFVTSSESGVTSVGLSGITSAITEALSQMNGQNGDIVIPVYLGGTMLDEVIVNAQQRMNLRSGGR